MVREAESVLADFMESRRGRFVPLALLALLVAPGPSAFSAAAAPAGCAVGGLEAAAAALVHAGAEVVEVAEVGGFVSALVLAPFVHPGVRFRLVEAGGLWCDAGAGFNAAWALAGRPADPLAMADAFVRVSAAPWFDGVDRVEIDAAGGVVAATTHARTNGVVARWTVVVDGRGVREAAWTSTEIAVEPMEFEIEGLTALPGLSVHAVRGADGLLAWLDPPWIEPRAVGPVRSPVTDGFGNDGFVLRVCLTHSCVVPETTTPTGVAKYDFLRFVRDELVVNYNELLAMGFTGGWSEPRGLVYVDGPNALTCFACVFVSPSFNIHISSEVVRYLSLNGYRYPDANLAFSLVLGHEMFHNFQNRYSLNFNGADTEGTARFQETLHYYASISHQSLSLVYARDANGCNGYLNTAVTNGPATRSYSACMFWLSWYADHGPSAFVDLFAKGRVAAPLGGFAETRGMILAATGGPVEDDLADFARALLTGRSLVFGTPAGGSSIDWGTLSRRLTAGDFPSSGTATATLQEGGMAVWRLRTGGTLALASGSTDAALHVVRATSTGSSVERVVGNSGSVAAPAAGETVWAVASMPAASAATVTVSFP